MSYGWLAAADLSSQESGGKITLSILTRGENKNAVCLPSRELERIAVYHE